MNQKIILLGTILAIAAISVPMAINYTSDKTPQKSSTKPYDYEDVCGFPVTDEMRLDVIYEESKRFSNDGFSYITLRGGTFSHVEISEHSEYEYPSLNYWFTLKNGEQIYFKIGACNIENPHVTLATKLND